MDLNEKIAEIVNKWWTSRDPNTEAALITALQEGLKEFAPSPPEATQENKP